jgi:hypothetical protein
MGVKLIGSTVALVALTVAFGSLKLVAPCKIRSSLYFDRVDLCYWFSHR